MFNSLEGIFTFLLHVLCIHCNVLDFSHMFKVTNQVCSNALVNNVYKTKQA